MVDQESIHRHYRIRNELKQIEYEDDARKNLIKLSILQVVANNHFKNLEPVGRTRRSKRQPVKPPKSSTPVKITGEQLNDYEVTINKLKLEHSTSSKLQKAKLNSLKDENMKLKSQIKDLKSSINKPSLLAMGNGPFTSKSRPSIFTSPTLKNPPSFSKARSSMVSSLSSMSVFDSVMTPIRKSKLTLHRTSRSTTEFSPSHVQSDTTATSTTLGVRSSSAVPSSPTRTALTASTPTKYMETFDKSENEGSSSPDFTPNRRKYKDVTPTDEADNTVTSSFVSANSTMQSVSKGGGKKSDDEKSKGFKKAKKPILKPKRKLQLSKSKKQFESKLDKNGNGKLSRGLDDDDLNPLNYYADENFEDLGLGSPTKKRRADDGDEIKRSKPKKKKRNIFSID